MCNEELQIKLNAKTQIVKAYNGLGLRHTLNLAGNVIGKLKLSSKKKIRRNIKTLKKLRDKNVVDDSYVQMIKNAFYSHISKSDENYFKMYFKEE